MQQNFTKRRDLHLQTAAESGGSLIANSEHLLVYQDLIRADSKDLGGSAGIPHHSLIPNHTHFHMRHRSLPILYFSSQLLFVHMHSSYPRNLRASPILVQ